MDEGQQLQIIVAARLDKYERDMQRAAKITNDRFRAMEGRAKQSATRMESSMATASTRIGDRLKGIGAGFLAGFSVQKAQEFIDKATRITNALKVAGLSGDNLTKVYDRLFISAQKNGAPLESLVQLYSRAALQQKELGVSSEDLLRFTDNVALALRVAGTDAQSASGALLQLGQALGSGTVHAEEFNSILEGAPTIAQAAAAGINEAGGSVAKLKQLVIDGKLSSKAFFDGFSAGAQTLAARAAGAETTISAGFVRLENVLTDVALHFDDNTHASRILANAIDTTLIPALRELGGIANWVVDGPLGKLYSTISATVDKIVQLSADVGAMTGLDKIGGNPYIGPGRIQERIDGAFAGTSYTTPKESRGGTEITVTHGTPVKPISLADYPVDTGGAGKGRGGSRGGGDGFERELQDTQRRIDLLRLETAAQAGVNPLVDDYGAAVEKARLKQELLNAAQDAGHKITPELEKTIDALAGSYADASADAQKLADKQDLAREKAEQWADLEKSTVGGFLQDLKNGTSPIDALNNALSRLADTMIDELLDAIFTVKNASGGGGIFGSLFGGLFGGGFGTVGGFAEMLGLSSGGYTGDGGKFEPKGVVHGGEYVFSKEATSRIGVGNLDIMHSALKGYAGGGYVGERAAATVSRMLHGSNDNTAPAVTINAPVTVNGSAGTPAQNADLAKRMSKQLEGTMRGVVVDELHRQMRPGNMLRNKGV